MLKITTPTGRIVWGHPGEPEIKKNMRTGAVVLNQQGEPVKQWAFGLAIPKDQFMATLWPHMQQLAAGVHGQAIPADFAWKIKDGDGLDNKGKPYSDREGHKGCYILTISTEAFAVPLYKWNAQRNDYDRLEANQIKCGDHVAAAIMLKHNGQTAGNGAGLYVNPEAVELIAYDKEIVGTSANPTELFASVNRAIPAGASATPVSSAPAGGGMPGQQPQQYAQQPQGGMPVNNGQQYVQQQPQQYAQQPQGGMPVNNGQQYVQQQPQGGMPVNNGQLPPPATGFVDNAVGHQPQGGMPVNNGFPQNNGVPQNGFPGQTAPR